MTFLKARSSLAPTLALVALTTSQAAHAQQACVEPEDVADTFVYIMPGAFDTALKMCGDSIGTDSFMRSNEGDGFIEKFRVQQDDAWPGTFRFIKAYIAAQADGDPGAAAMLDAAPPETIRPFIDGMLGSMIGEQLKPDMCVKINRVLELASPLPVENMGGLVAFIIEEVDLKEPDICKNDGTVTVIPEGPVAE